MGWLMTVLLGLLIILIVFVYRDFTYWQKKGIPYIRTFPILGVFIPVFLRRKALVQHIVDVYKFVPGAKYYGCLDFSVPTIIVKDPEIIKEVGIKNFDFFPNHRTFVDEDFDPIFSQNVFNLKDDRWREIRSTLSPSFTANKMKFMFQLVSKCSSDFVSHLKDHPEIADELELKDAFTRYTNDVIATAAFGISVNSMKDRDNDFYVNGLDASNFDGWLKILRFITTSMFPKFARAIGLTFLSKKVTDFFRTLVYDSVRTREEKGIVRPDMIHLLMQARDNDNGIKLENDDIAAQAFVFFLAGFDTSSRLMCFVTHLLSHYPDIQERLREEVDSALDENEGDINYETLAKMKYMDMVVSETLRLYPPMPFTDRVCIKAYTLPSPMEGYPGFTVQPNTTVWIPIFGFHHDPENFPDPEKFDPERFNDKNKNDIKPCTYIPFGFGPRKCIGERFALMETKILVIHLLQHFVIKPSPKTTRVIELRNTKSFNLTPANGFWVQLEKRER